MTFKRLMILMALLIYVVSPVDLLPGLPFDDLLVIAFGIWQMQLPSEG